MTKYILSKWDKGVLRRMGHRDDEMRQLEDACNKTTYELLSGSTVRFNSDYMTRKSDGTIAVTREYAIKKLGKRWWLSGISRCAFHASAVREEKGAQIYFSYDIY